MKRLRGRIFGVFGILIFISVVFVITRPLIKPCYEFEDFLEYQNNRDELIAWSNGIFSKKPRSHFTGERDHFGVALQFGTSFIDKERPPFLRVFGGNTRTSVVFAPDDSVLAVLYGAMQRSAIIVFKSPPKMKELELLANSKFRHVSGNIYFKCDFND